MDNKAIFNAATEDLSELASAFVRADLLRLDSDLFNTKWWDYRHLHSVQSTILYAEAYVAVKKRFIRKLYDLYKGLNYRPFKKENLFFESSDIINSLWKGRQMADQLGVPYDFYISKAFLYTETRNWKALPLPKHLYSEKVNPEHIREGMPNRTMVEDIGIQWLEFQSNHIVFGKDPIYKVKNYRGEKHQRDHMRYLVGQIRRRQNPEFSVCSFIYDEKILPESVFIKLYGDDAEELLHSAKKYATTVN